MPNNFYITSNQIQTPFNCYFDIYSDKWMYYYNMVFKLNDTVPDVQYDHPLQNISSEWYYKHIRNAKYFLYHQQPNTNTIQLLFWYIQWQVHDVLQHGF